MYIFMQKCKASKYKISSPCNFLIDKPSYFFGCARKDINLHKNSHSILLLMYFIPILIYKYTSILL